MLSVCQGGHLDIVKWLYEHGADVMRQDNSGVTPLEEACRLDHIDIVDMLISKGHPPTGDIARSYNMLNFQSRTLLHEHATFVRNDHEGFVVFMFYVKRETNLPLDVLKYIVREFLCGNVRSMVLWQDILTPRI